MACIRTVLPLRKPAAISICVTSDKTFMEKLVGKIDYILENILCDLGYGGTNEIQSYATETKNVSTYATEIILKYLE